jgi:murein DD-endopeptidase MepM/ murein hydrolase activator NlpD
VLLCAPALQISASNISQAQQEKKSLEKELADAQKLIGGLKDSKDDIETKVSQLDAKLTNISGRINSLEAQLDKKNTEITSAQAQLTQAQSDESAQYEQMKKRIKYMYENGSEMSILESLFTSGSMADFINQTEYMRQITSYDRQMLEKYQNTQKSVADTKTALESDYGDLTAMKEQVQKEQDTVSALMNAKEQELNSVAGKITDAQTGADAVAAEIESQNDIIAQIQAEEARKAAERAAAAKAAQEAAQNQAANGSTEQPSDTNGGSNTSKPDDSYNGGAFKWPCPSSTKITSDYGTRLSPMAGASSNHKGIDIAAPYGSAIVAAADGTVSFAGYSSATGNYIMLSHGGGVYTIYCHCSALLVSTGQKVAAGQTIGQVGSTGISTGNHLHFGVTCNGSYVSPWNYLSK